MLQVASCKIQRSKGFTLIELLVVIFIVGLLAVLISVNISSIRAKTRDTRRVADIKSIQEGLALYNNNHQQYPDSGGGSIAVNGSTDALSQALLNDEVMQGVPTDPISNTVDGVTYQYFYQSLFNESDYELIYYLETDSILNKNQGENKVRP